MPMPMPTPAPDASLEQAAALEATVDKAIAACNGDTRGAVRALIVTMSVYEAEIAALQQETASLRAVISPGYVRGRVGRGKGAGNDA